MRTRLRVGKYKQNQEKAEPKFEACTRSHCVTNWVLKIAQCVEGRDFEPGLLDMYEFYIFIERPPWLFLSNILLILKALINGGK